MNAVTSTLSSDNILKNGVNSPKSQQILLHHYQISREIDITKLLLQFTSQIMIPLGQYQLILE